MNVINSPLPSILAASTISSGNEDFIYCNMKNTTAGAATAGTIRGMKLSYSLI